VCCTYKILRFTFNLNERNVGDLKLKYAVLDDVSINWNLIKNLPIYEQTGKTGEGTEWFTVGIRN
jgi:hypothetical protein